MLAGIAAQRYYGTQAPGKAGIRIRKFLNMAEISPPDRRTGSQKTGKAQSCAKSRKTAHPQNGFLPERPPGDKSTKPPPKAVAASARPTPHKRPPFPARRQAYAAIDLGTNNCRLLIARPSSEGFTVIDAFSRVVRLGEGLAQTNRLGEQAMERTLAALKVCADKLKRRNVHLARSVATEACRRAENGPTFIERVRQETGIALDMITAEEEARLAVLGCHVLLEEGPGPAMIFDIGGGSTELVLVEQSGTIPQILDWQSIPWGVVSLTEHLGREARSPVERAAHYARMRELVSESLIPFCERIGPMGIPQLRLLGTSGTVTTLASLHLDLPQYDRKAVDGLIVSSDTMRNLSQQLSVMSAQERRQLPSVGQERADLVIAGCAILESILDIWPASRLGIADRGIREGILRSLIASDRAGDQTRRALHRQLKAQMGTQMGTLR